MDKSKKFKKIIGISIIAVIIIIICILIMLLNMNNMNNNENSNIIYENNVSNEEQKQSYKNYADIGDPPTYKEPEYSTNTLIKVSDIDEYFAIKNIIYSYFYSCKQLNINESNIEIPRGELTEEEIKEYIETEVANTQEISKNAVYNMLADKYINEYGITKENIREKFKITYSYKTIIQNIYASYNENDVCSYLVSGINRDTTNNKNLTFSIMITIDKLNNTFIIWPEEYLKKYNYNNLKLGNKLQINIKSIENKNYNTFEDEIIEKAKIAEEYFDNYKYSMLYNLSNTYEKLDEEYAKMRFGNKEKFNEYLKDNYDLLTSSLISKYKTTSNGNYTEYKCIDNHNNVFIFRLYDSVTDYKVLLDDYTIMKGAVVYKYTQMNKISKAQYRLENFIKQLNTKDYNAIYNSLNSTFKNNNYKNLNSLKKYIKNSFYNLNSIEVKESDIETYEYCVLKCKLTNMENTKENKDITVIINIKEGTDFDMSFSIN